MYAESLSLGVKEFVSQSRLLKPPSSPAQLQLFLNADFFIPARAVVISDTF